MCPSFSLSLFQWAGCLYLHQVELPISGNRRVAFQTYVQMLGAVHDNHAYAEGENKKLREWVD